jgi:RHS repeat-associated protein
MATENIGALTGHFSIGSDGEAAYQIPLPLPPGTAGMAPALSLVYNSGGPNGILGVGWQLAGLSTVSRVGRTPAQDGAHGAVLYDGNDRFTLDGARQVAVQGNYGDAGAVYHTEIERWSKVTPTYGNTPNRSGPDSFTVITKAGLVQQFGVTPDSQVVASSDNPSIRIWALSRSTDRNGNFMTVAYNTADGACAPARIDYTGNGDDLQPQRSVQFTYEDRPDPFTRYVGGYPVNNTKRLTAIDVFVTQQGAATKVMTYRLAYQTGTGTGRSQLVSVTQCDGAGNTLSPTVFTWQQGAAQPLSSPVTTTPTGANFGGTFLPFDIDGGGRLGFLNAYPDANNNLAVDLYAISAGGLTGPVATPVAQCTPPVPAAAQLFPVDVDGNGCTDLVCATENTAGNVALTVFVATPTQGSWNLQLAGSVGGALPNSQLPSGAGLYPADVNGDGATDFVAVTENADGTAQFTVLLSNGQFTPPSNAGAYEAQTPTSFSTLYFGGQCIPLDADGDGLTDIVYAYPNASNQLQIAVLRSNGTSLQNDAKLTLNTGLPYSGALMPLDVNGDGLVDLVYATSDGTNTVLTVLINTGAGFALQPSQTFSIPFADTPPLLAPGDVNGDGSTDLIAAVPNADDSMQLQILLSTGSGFALSAAPPPSVPNAGGAQVLPIDLAGVGMAGVVILAQSGGDTLNLLSIAPTGAFPDLMTSVTNGLGAQYTITYKPLTDSSVYQHTSPSLNPLGMLAGGNQGATFQPSQPSASTLQPGTAAAVAPARIVTVPRYAAASYVKSDGNGGQYSYSYRYSNAEVDVVGGRGWLGFATQTFTDDDLGSISSTTFGQDFPLTGTVVSHSISRASDQALMFGSTLKPQTLQPYQGVWQVVIAQNQTQLYTFGRLDRTRVVNTTYDSYGNPTVISDLGDGTGAPLYTTNAFNNDPIKWIIGQPAGATQAADPANTQVLSRWQRNYDPATGNLTQHSVWHDQSGVWLTTAYTYDRFGNCLSEVGPDASATDFTYDTAFNTFLNSTTKPPTEANRRLTTRYTYEPVFGTLVETTDANGTATSQQIDGFGRLIGKSASDPNGNLVQVAKIAMRGGDGGNYRETQTTLDWTGAAWTWQRQYLDGLSRVYRTVTLGADGSMQVIIDRKHNSKDQVISETLPYVQGAVPLVMTSTYDAFSRVIEQTKPADGGATSVTTFAYPDVSTRVLTEASGTAAARQTTTVHGTFNGKARQLTITDATNATTPFQYDALGQLIGTTDAVGTQTSMTYDSLGQKTGFTTTHNGKMLRSEASRYDLVTRVITTTDSRGETVTQFRDALGRVTGTTDGDGNRTTFEYDTAPSFGLDRLASQTAPDGSRYEFDYDRAGNQTSITTTIGGQSYIVTRTFLPTGKVQQQTFPDGAVQTSSFTPGGRLSSITIAEGARAVASLSFANYNAFGKPATITNGNGVTETLDYNALGQLHQQIIDGPSSRLSQDVFLWNLLDDLQSIEDQLAPVQSYSFGYDAAGRLTSADGPYRSPQRFAYDAAGNLINKAGATLQYQDGILVAAGGTTIQHDAGANASAITADGTTTNLAYDADGRLRQAGNSSFTYDHWGRRLSKSTPGGTTTYYVTPDYEVTKLPNGGMQHTKYLRSPLGLCASITTADAAGAGSAAPLPGVPAPGVCYFHRNQVNSTTLVTDKAGARQARLTYLPFGEIASLTGSDTFRAKFAGCELDRETGLSYFGARYYSAEFGRFISPDDRLGGPLGLRDISNAYAYVLNSPVCRIDPTGHNLFSDIGQGFSAIGKGIASGCQSIGEHFKSSAKIWAPYVVDGLLIVGGAALIASGVGVIVGTGLFVAGLTGLSYTIQSGGNFSWEHWGVQVALGFAVGVAGAGASGVTDSLLADYMLGSAGRILAMGLTGAASGAAGGAFSTSMTNLDNGRSGSQGVGWAAVVGAGTGFAGGAAAEGLSGSGALSEMERPPPASDEKINYSSDDPAIWEDPPVAKPLMRVLKPGTSYKIIVKTQPLWFGIGGKAIILYGPQWTW